MVIMNLGMEFIIFAVIFFVGTIIASFTIIPLLIILRFGIPFTKRLEKKKILIENNGIIRKYLVSFLILSTIILTTILITYFLFPQNLVALVMGCGLSFLFGLGKTGENENNVTDYFTTNKNKLNEMELNNLYKQSKKNS